jgi:hypothetical protein
MAEVMNKAAVLIIVALVPGWRRELKFCLYKS